MNDFRKKLLGEGQPEERLLRSKAPKAVPSRAAEEESFADLAIPRAAVRAANHRDGDRHRLGEEDAVLVHEGEKRAVVLINLSGGGAMIEPAGALKLWDRVDLELGETNRLEAVVRWIRADRAGLEFAHETQIDAPSDEVAETLRAVIRRSFPDVALEADASAGAPEGESDEAARGEEGSPSSEELADRDVRHPLIWSGLIHFNHDSTPVRLRNISHGGALIESSSAFPVGAELLLDLGEAGAIFSSVHWARGDQIGLKFHTPYDLRRLANARPEVAPARWTAPDYLRESRSDNSPWASQWGRSDVRGLHRSLEMRQSSIRKR
jgi:hypothetical protein